MAIDLLLRAFEWRRHFLPKAAGRRVTRQVRREAGESRASLSHFDKPLFNQTTTSLDALKEYAEAIPLVDSGNLAGAIALYRHVIELDPRFAIAYGDMAAMYSNMGDRPRAQEAMAKAYALRDTVNERERLDLEYLYHQIVTGDLTRNSMSFANGPPPTRPYTEISAILMGWSACAVKGV